MTAAARGGRRRATAGRESTGYRLKVFLSAPYHQSVAFVTVLVFAAGAFWAIVQPPFFGPDEIPHYNSVSRVAAGDGWPRPYDASIRGDTWQAAVEGGGENSLSGFEFDDEVPDELPTPIDRNALHGPTEYDDNMRDQMVQHPPAPYVLTAGVIQVFGGGDMRWDHALLLMRLVSAGFLAASVPFIVGIIRRISGSRAAGVVGATAILSIPLLAMIGGFVNNDNVLTASCSAALYFAIRAVKDPPSQRFTLPLAGVALGAALLSKGLALMLVPVIGLFGLVAAFTSSRPWPMRLVWAAVPMLIAFVVGGWWWLRNLLILGVIQPSQYGSREPDPQVQQTYDFGAFNEAFWDRFNRLFWGRGANDTIAFPERLVESAGFALIALIVLSLAFSRHRILLIALLAFPLLITATIYNNAHSIYSDIGIPDRGVQGRYVFAGIAAYAALVGLLWWAIAVRFRRIGSVLAVAITLGAAAITMGSALWVVPRLYLSPSRFTSYARAAEAMGVSTLVLQVLVVAFLVSLVALMVLQRRLLALDFEDLETATIEEPQADADEPVAAAGPDPQS